MIMQSVDAAIREAIEEYIRTGWSLMLPPGAIVLLGAVAQLEARQHIGNFNAALPLAMQAGALAAPAWGILERRGPGRRSRDGAAAKARGGNVAYRWPGASSPPTNSG